MEHDDEAIVWFRGRHEGEHDLSDYFDVDDDGVADLATLDDMGEDELWEVIRELGCCGIEKDSPEDDLREAITRRVEKESEPIVQVKHYFARNKGKKGMELFLNCANADAAATAPEWQFETDCRCCHERMNGDKGVSTMTPFTWTVWDTREVHRVPGEGKDGKDKYESCTMRTKNRCRWCSHNNGIDARDQDDIKRDDLKSLAKQGYCIKYRNGLRLLELAESQYGLIEALEAEVRQNYCRSCGEEALQLAGANCPECSEEFDFDPLMATGWDPDKPSALTVRCEHCSASVKPLCAFTCSSCNDPVPARLGDVPVKVRMTKEGRNERRVWTFKVAGNAEPFVLGESPEKDRIINAKLFDFEEVTKAPTVAQQLATLGTVVDPITGEEVQIVQTSKVPTVGSSTRKQLSKGGKPPKGGKVGKTSWPKPGTIKTVNRKQGSRFTKRA